MASPSKRSWRSRELLKGSAERPGRMREVCGAERASGKSHAEPISLCAGTLLEFARLADDQYYVHMDGRVLFFPVFCHTLIRNQCMHFVFDFQHSNLPLRCIQFGKVTAL